MRHDATVVLLCVCVCVYVCGCVRLRCDCCVCARVGTWVYVLGMRDSACRVQVCENTYVRSLRACDCNSKPQTDTPPRTRPRTHARTHARIHPPTLIHPPAHLHSPTHLPTLPLAAPTHPHTHTHLVRPSPRYPLYVRVPLHLNPRLWESLIHRPIRGNVGPHRPRALGEIRTGHPVCVCVCVCACRCELMCG